ncbi:acetate and sugar kinases/Hsc70/actin family protein [Lacrimispora algidixylanolytica]|uniref:Molecular chaperone n=1 Tax=Lacrimispora algidixylanolytica TaxID=94868 RepID=A0A419SZI1_9FIRM|nr:hypothetical protein [Lacrimispora algidixylanolytica]RKD30697.1 hypothetical protein BET01_05095 [Lacrimispora algidixylanolytica]
MSRYTYTLHPGTTEPEKGTYKRSKLEKMTTFQLSEICRKEKLVMSSGNYMDREGLMRLIMRFRGQKDYRHIAEALEGGLLRLQDFLDQNHMDINSSQDVIIPGTIILYEGTGLNELDQYKVKSDIALYEGNLLLVDENLQIYTCFYLKEIEDTWILFQGASMPIKPLTKHQYSILYFPNERDSEFLYDCYQGNVKNVPGRIEAVRIPLLNIEVKEVTDTDLPLVIDFGSSNTTMGICLPDGTTKIARAGNGNIIPSVIGVEETEEGKHGFLFGYEALALEKQNYQDEDVPVFFDIKRWVSDSARLEGVILKSGFKYQISRRDMLSAFLEYLMNLAKQQFKCRFKNIQFLAPIRQKEKFQDLFKELLPGYNVNCELDEGMAVLFNTIHGMILNNQYERGRWYQALIIDCGGGTTDLTSGRFSIENSRISYTINLETRYENGDTNFGGNNLTFRILQMLKIKIVRALSIAGEEWDEQSRDEGGLKRINDQYERAEAILPTRFKKYEEKSRNHYFRVKNNYYYLFQLAEEVKKSFFQASFQYELFINTEKNQINNEMFLDKWKLSIRDKTGLTHIDQDIRFPLYLNEIEFLLQPDIYHVMERFLDQKFEQGELQEYEMLKLTGQSCKSRLFTEALKQYVPGKLIQSTKREGDDAGLKMCCLEGALSYFMDCKRGYMKVNQDYQVRTLPYEIMAYTHENQEKILIRSLDEEDQIGCISRFMVGKQLDLYLSDEKGKRLKAYYFEYDTETFVRTTQEEIEREYEKSVIQEETDTILEGEMKFFVWVSRKRWGFLVLPVLRENEVLYKGKETFFDFEDDTWEENFFDGRK